MLACIIFLISSADLNGQCSEPSSNERATLVDYVGKLSHVAPGNLELIKVERVQETCFWSLQFKAAKPVRYMQLFLTPDHGYLVPSFSSLGVDPLEHERAVNLIHSKALKTFEHPTHKANSPTVDIVGLF